MSTDRVTPSMEDITPIHRLDELQAHLSELVEDPASPVNLKLFDDVELQLTETNIPPLLSTLLPPLAEILKSTTQDPTPLLSLSRKLLNPLSFTRAIAIADPPSLLAALRSPVPGANLLALSVLHKAAKSPSDAAILSTLPVVVQEVLRRWLDSEDTGVGETAARVLEDVLRVDCELVAGQGVNGTSMEDGGGSINGTEVVTRRPPGHGRMWRLLLLDRSVLSIIPALCSQPSTTPSSDSQRTSRQISISQGRLLRLLTRLATINIRVLTHTPFSDLFPLPEAKSSSAGHGLLQWAALGMVDEVDVLMHLSLIDFYETLVSVMRVAPYMRGADEEVENIVRVAVAEDEELSAALQSLPNRTVEEEAEPLRRYIAKLLG